MSVGIVIALILIWVELAVDGVSQLVNHLRDIMNK